MRLQLLRTRRFQGTRVHVSLFDTRTRLTPCPPGMAASTTPSRISSHHIAHRKPPLKTKHSTIALEVPNHALLTSTSSIVRGHRRAGSRRTSSCWSLARLITVLRQTGLAAATRPRARAAATWVARRPAMTAELVRVVGDRIPPPGAAGPDVEVDWAKTAAVTSAKRCTSCRATSPVGMGMGARCVEGRSGGARWVIVDRAC